MRYKGLYIEHIDGRVYACKVHFPDRLRPNFYKSVKAAQRAIDTWEHKQYKRDKRKFD